MNLYISLASLVVPSSSGCEGFSEGVALFTEEEGPKSPMVGALGAERGCSPSVQSELLTTHLGLSQV